MSTRERPADRGARIAKADLERIGSELRNARVAAGLSLAAVAAAVRMSGSHVARIERGLVPTASVLQLATIGAVVGLDVRIRAYVGGDPLRDAGQARLLQRLLAILGPQLRMRLEVPLPNPGDQRAWDGWISGFVEVGHGRALAVEGESRFTDAQAQIRRLILKMRDAAVDQVLLVIADTPSNRAAVRSAGPILGGTFPVSARSAKAALRAGRHPGGSALILL
jgi:transcriptional regulator with XRE-family HTH domain